MSTSHVRADTGISCDRFVAALTDFSHRQGVFGNSDVAGRIWQRLRYEWSQRGRVQLDVLDGNAFGRGGWCVSIICPRAPTAVTST
jgi:hypothetical protein